MKCFITSYTRKKSNVAFQALYFQTLWFEKSAGEMKCLIMSSTRKKTSNKYRKILPEVT